MASVHKGDSDEVKRLGDLLIRIIKQLRDTQKDKHFEKDGWICQ